VNAFALTIYLRRATLATCLLVLSASSFSVSAQPGAPLGPPFAVSNTVSPTDGSDIDGKPVIARDASGDFVVVWYHDFQDVNFPGDIAGIYARAFAGDGTPLSAQFVVSATPPTTHAVAIDDSGNFVVVWTAVSSTDSRSHLYAQRYDIAGTLHGDMIDVTAITPASGSITSALAPNVVMDTAGNFAVGWSHLVTLQATGQSMSPSSSQPLMLQSIHARLYNADGTPKAKSFSVQTGTPVVGTDFDFTPRMAMDPSGDLAFVWVNERAQNRFALYGRLFAPDGGPVADSFRISEPGLYAQEPSVAMDGAGNFVVTWIGWPTPAPIANEGVYARLYSAGGTVTGDSFLVWQSAPIPPPGPPAPELPDADAVAMDRNGNFAVSWGTSLFEAGRVIDAMYGEFFTPEGWALGGQFIIDIAAFDQFGGIGVDASGNLVATWVHSGYAGGGDHIEGALFAGP